eukprot:2311804-Prymnesium_polylepis.1
MPHRTRRHTAPPDVTASHPTSHGSPRHHTAHPDATRPPPITRRCVPAPPASFHTHTSPRTRTGDVDSALVRFQPLPFGHWRLAWCYGRRGTGGKRTLTIFFNLTHSPSPSIPALLCGMG